jgi:hypothetical protein
VLLALGAMAGGFTTAGIADGQRAREQILGEWELAEQRVKASKITNAKIGGF